LHMARILGLHYKCFVCLMGQVVAMLSVTSVYIWLKKLRLGAFRKNGVRYGQIWCMVNLNRWQHSAVYIQYR